nr:hypothetical protein [Tanacetum cinerariifolium]
VFPYPGKVQTIEADFNNETGNIAFRATFPNPDGLLRNGETGSVLMTVPLKHALIIPQKATFEVLEKKFVICHRDIGGNCVHGRAGHQDPAHLAVPRDFAAHGDGELRLPRRQRQGAHRVGADSAGTGPRTRART